ncbi:MAG: hypothetical protein WD670_04165, partial [Actinomycetota bacterium]
VVSLLIGVTLMFPLDAVAASPDGFSVVREMRFFERTPVVERVGTDSLLRMGAAGLALGAAVGAWVELLLLRTRIRIVFGRIRIGGAQGRAIFAGGLAALVVGTVCRSVVTAMELPARIEALLVLSAIGAVYLAVTRIASVPEARALLRQLRLERR